MTEWLPRVSLDAPAWMALLLLLVPMWMAAGRRTLQGHRAKLAFAARVGVLLAISLAAAGLNIKRPADRLGVVFVLDRSASLAESARDAALAFVQGQAEGMRDGDRAAVVVVGDGAMVELEPGTDLAVPTIESQVSPHQTDIAAGLRLAEALMPSDFTRRIVVLSDGEETRGDAVAQGASAADDVELWTLPLTRASGDEALLEGMTAPDQVPEGSAFELRVIARSTAAGTGRLSLFRNDTLLGVLPVKLSGGRADVFALRQEADESGFLRYRASLEVDGGDSIPQNNVAVATVAVEGRPRVLYVEGKPDQAGYLTRVLEAEGLQVDVVGPGDLPGSLAALQPYNVVLLSDVPAYALTGRQMQLLERYVRDLGRGFAMLGGDESFGVGGYYGTPVEEILPVRMDIKDKRHFPTLAMSLAIDTSGSMGGVGPAEKLGMAKEAAIQTTDLMADRDRVGVISFDAAASWVVPMTSLDRRKQVVSTISKLRAGGGTDVYPALKESYRALFKESTAMKHIILLSDGITMGGDFETLIKLGQKRGVTLTTIGVGGDSDRFSMETWARWGGGRYYLVAAPEHIPRIFTREAMLATRSFLMEEPFVPVLGAPDAITKGLVAPLPTLGGYVATEPKPRAKVAMWARKDENTPLLAVWRHGLGRSVAWTSDCKARWANQWIGTDTYTRTFTQMVRWLAASEGSADVSATAELERGLLEVTVDAYDAEGGFRNFLDGEARFIAPDLSVRSMPLQQVAPGRYRARVDADQNGAHLVAVFLKDAEGNAVGQATAEAAQPYSPEYRPGQGGEALLSELARVGRGETLDPAVVVPEPLQAGIWTPPLRPRLVPHPQWPALLVLAALLFLVDAALRRLAWPLWQPAVPEAVTEVAAVPPAAPPRSPPAETMRPSGPMRPSGRPTARNPAPLGDAPITPAPVPPPEPNPEPTRSEEYVGGLLAARRRARKKGSKDES
ncbi:MAG: VWA domain-containing protein [Deltaproteobacteria bacterium]|nr:VWA domain-containing protein [Deltaproteobacteria bacterium]